MIDFHKLRDNILGRRTAYTKAWRDERNAGLENINYNSLTCKRVVRTKCDDSLGPGWGAGQRKQVV